MAVVVIWQRKVISEKESAEFFWIDNMMEQQLTAYRPNRRPLSVLSEGASQSSAVVNGSANPAAVRELAKKKGEKQHKGDSQWWEAVMCTNDNVQHTMTKGKKTAIINNADRVEWDSGWRAKGDEKIIASGKN